ncbi:MAG: hypothetical protein F6K17_35200 [Okeania sp. SIO3C4]|nr:hypothetical protein [Okeania sp. SIO3C4]
MFRNAPPYGIIKVEVLPDNCICQEVFFGAAVCRHYETWYFLDRYKRPDIPLAKSIKEKLIDYFNELGYFEAEEIPVPKPERDDNEGIRDPYEIPF